MIYEGDALTVLKTFDSESVDCCITSPPYFGLRDYGTANWSDGDEDCDHMDARSRGEDIQSDDKQGTSKGSRPNKSWSCSCGAEREDLQIGLEETPENFVQALVEVFREVRRVLKKDGTLWLNLGDSYNSGRNGGHAGGLKQASLARHNGIEKSGANVLGLKPKDIIGIPWRVAFALQADGWYLRQDIIWAKPNPMPESVTDRCTKSHEYVFLLSKSPKYYFDNEAIKEKSVGTDPRMSGGGTGVKNHNGYFKEDGTPIGDPGMRNKRSVWSVTTSPFPDAHFATFPEKLIEPMILAGCPEKGIVLDCFFGASTTGAVAKKLNRNYIGIELNPEYIEIAERRIDGITNNLFAV